MISKMTYVFLKTEIYILIQHHSINRIEKRIDKIIQIVINLQKKFRSRILLSHKIIYLYRVRPLKLYFIINIGILCLRCVNILFIIHNTKITPESTKQCHRLPYYNQNRNLREG